MTIYTLFCSFIASSNPRLQLHEILYIHGIYTDVVKELQSYARKNCSKHVRSYREVDVVSLRREQVAAITFQLSVRLILVRGETVQALIRERVLHGKKRKKKEKGKRRKTREGERGRERIVTNGERSVSAPLTGIMDRDRVVSRLAFRL